MTNITDDNDVEEPYSSYWIDSETDDTRILRLASIRKAVANFVHILTSDTSIQVKFSSGTTSFTDGKTVVISADDSSDAFDTTVGLALHEGAHCLLTNFSFLRIISANVNDFHSALHPELRKLFDAKNQSDEEFNRAMTTLREHMMHIMNIIEDRRIDAYVYRTAPGYRPYYESLYRDYHFTADISKNLRHNPEWRVPTIENYMTWMLMIISPDFDVDALPALNQIVDLIDIDNISRLDDSHGPTGENVFTWGDATVDPQTFKLAFEQNQFSELWRIANEIMLIVLKQAKFYAEKTHTPFEFDIDGIDITDMGDSNLPNLDIPQGRFNAGKGRKSINNIKDLMNGTNRRRKLTKKEQDQIFSIESADATLKEYHDSMIGVVPCIITRKLTADVLNSTWFPFGPNYERIPGKRQVKTYIPYSYSEKGIVAGIRMGQLLTHRLQIRNDPTITHFTRREHGKIDRRLLAQLGMDITSVFKKTTIDQYRPAMLHLSLDASSSMCEEKWEKVITVATALAYTAEKIQNLDVVVTLRGTTKKDMPMLSIVYDSRIDKFHKIRTMFPYLRPMNRTPEGLAFLASMELIEECTSTHQVYFINFSDGEPICQFAYNGVTTVYKDYLARNHSKKMIQDIRNSGTSILSYFISTTKYNTSYSWQIFKEIYGVDAQFVDVQHALTVLRTLNTLLIIKD